MLSAGRGQTEAAWHLRPGNRGDPDHERADSPPQCCTVETVGTRFQCSISQCGGCRSFGHYAVSDRIRPTARKGMQIGNPMTTGVVKWFNDEKGYGFITPDDGSADVFAHFSNIVQDGGRRSLFEDEKVEFEITQGPKGLQADNITRIG